MTDTTTPARIGYRPEIDGLRAVAVLMVVAYHTGLGCPGGFVGVDVFFVISGFLITSLLLKDFDAGQFSFAQFYERRIRRILPASVAVTAAVLLVAYFQFLPLDLEWLGVSAVVHAVGGANVFFYGRTTNYFGGSAQTMPLLHMWSLAVEEQFYLVFPFVMWACYRARRPRRAAAIVIGVALALSFGWAVRQTSADPMAAFFLPASRAWELMTGAALALLPTFRGPRFLRETLAWTGLVAIAVPAGIYTSSTSFPGVAALPPCVGAALFIAANRSPTTAGRILASRGPVFVGAISYSLYLVHWPVAVFARYWAVTPAPWTQRIGQLALTFVLAVLSWRFIERPFRERRWGTTRRSLVASAAAGLAIVAVAGGVYKIGHGLPRRYSKTVNALDAVRRAHLRLAQHTAADVVADRLTAFGATDATTPVSILLWGDSHAAAALPAFDAVCKARGLKGRAVTHSSLTPLLDYAGDATAGPRDDAIALNRAVVDYVERHHVRSVFIVNFWERDLQGDPAALDAAMGRTIDALRRLGVTVYVMLQVPSYAVDVPKALARESIDGRELRGWRETSADHRRAQVLMYQLAEKYKASDCRFIDPMPAFERKSEDFLAVSSGGKTYYGDRHHLTPWAAKRVLGPVIAQSLSMP